MNFKGRYTRGCPATDNSKNFYFKGTCAKLNVFNWLKDIPVSINAPDVVEVRFKNTRKGFFKNVNNLVLKEGEIVVVEAQSGHDVGIVSLIGELVIEQIKKYASTAEDGGEFKKIYRKAKPVDIEKWDEAMSLEHYSMIRARKIAESLKLNMKIGDVEYQGDKTKAIFYYISEERVDFRELIKIYAEEFKIRVEMRQIGARQEAGRIGGIGPCGRELCCTGYLSNFVSVTTNAARYQELPLNPQKLAGQCSKLKCCLNYELACYMDVRKDFPDISAPLKTKKGNLIHQKTDVLKRLMWFSFEEQNSENFIPFSVERVKEIIDLNKKGIEVEELLNEKEAGELDIKTDIIYDMEFNEDSISRFDKSGNKPKKKKHRKPRFQKAKEQ